MSMGLNSEAEHLLAGRWIAGERISDAIRVAKRLNDDGIAAIINYLGERHTDEKKVMSTVKEYSKLISSIEKSFVKADIALKPTEIGLAIDEGEFVRNYTVITRLALKHKVFVWLDMEESEFVDSTMRAYMIAVKKRNVGICIQSYLKRSEGDLEELLSHKAIVRLVKGAYRPKGREFYSSSGTDRNYVKLMRILFERGDRFTIASHDARVVEAARRLNGRYRRDVTYAMLEGMRMDYAERLAGDGEKVSIYVPYGKEWAAYSYRRLRELGSLKLVARSLLGG